MIHLDYRDARPIYTQIVDGFVQQIRAGILAPGDKLPSVRELATQLTINPNTIQRAYRELESEGWVASVPGKGSFVCELPQLPAEEAALLQALSDAAEKLLERGYTRKALAEYLLRGGNENA